MGHNAVHCVDGWVRPRILVSRRLSYRCTTYDSIRQRADLPQCRHHRPSQGHNNLVEDNVMAQPKVLSFLADTRRLPRRARPPSANAIAGFLAAGLASAAAPGAVAATFCAQTANAALAACQADVNVTFYTSTGVCINETDDIDRAKCNADAQLEKTSGSQLCNAQKQERLRVCNIVEDRLGGRYDPAFEPQQFVNPDNIGRGVKPNPYFPLVVGTVFTYVEKDPKGKPSGQVTTDTVADETKLIDGVTCRVVKDVVKKNGVMTEVTDDWFAQDQAGNVWYCGEM